MKSHTIFATLAFLSITAAALALMREVWLRRGKDQHPIVLLVRERFGRRWGSPLTLLVALLAGLAATFIPLLLGVLSGRVQASLNGPPSLAETVKGLLNILLVFVWAGAEELTYRGAVMTAFSRFSSRGIALVCTAILFAMEHVGAYHPNAILSAVWVMDGLCFGIAYLLTGSLWMPTVWHTAHNLGIWSMGFFVIQLTPGWIHVEYGGAASWMTAAYGVTSACITFIAVAAYLRATDKLSRPNPSRQTLD